MSRAVGETIFQVGSELANQRQKQKQQELVNAIALRTLRGSEATASRKAEQETSARTLTPDRFQPVPGLEGAVLDVATGKIIQPKAAAANIFAGGNFSGFPQQTLQKPQAPAGAVEFDDETGEFFDVQGNVIGGRNG